MCCSNIRNISLVPFIWGCLKHEAFEKSVHLLICKMEITKFRALTWQGLLRSGKSTPSLCPIFWPLGQPSWLCTEWQTVEERLGLAQCLLRDLLIPELAPAEHADGEFSCLVLFSWDVERKCFVNSRRPSTMHFHCCKRRRGICD